METVYAAGYAGTGDVEYRAWTGGHGTVDMEGRLIK